MKSRSLKQIFCGILIAFTVLLPCQRSPAPLLPGLALALKCVGLGAIGSTALIIWKCDDQPWYLVRYQLDDEDPWWGVSRANPSTLAKTGGRRCQGPGSQEELLQRAWENTHSQVGFPMHPCGILGAPLPAAVRTNYSIVSIQHKTDVGNQWRSVGSFPVVEGDFWSVCVLGKTGTAGMTREELQQVVECNLIVTNALPDPSEIADYDVRGFVTEVPSGRVRNRPAKPFGQAQ